MLKYKELIREAARDEATLVSLENDLRKIQLIQAKIIDPWKIITKPTLLKKPVAPSKKKISILGLFLGIIIGGRLGYVFFYNLEFYFYNPFEILKIWNGGMSFHGAMVGIIISIGWFSSKNNKSFFDLTDIICLVSPIGIFFGRIANFINGELYGKVTDHTFGIIFPRGGELPRHPSQLYEAFFEGLILFIILNCLFFFTNLKSKSGIISSLFLILYGIFRFSIETLREPDAHIGLLWNLLSMGQLLCVPMIASGIVLLVYVKKLNEQQIN